MMAIRRRGAGASVGKGDKVEKAGEFIKAYYHSISDYSGDDVRNHVPMYIG